MDEAKLELIKIAYLLCRAWIAIGEILKQGCPDWNADDETRLVDYHATLVLLETGAAEHGIDLADLVDSDNSPSVN